MKNMVFLGQIGLGNGCRAMVVLSKANNMIWGRTTKYCLPSITTSFKHYLLLQ